MSLDLVQRQEAAKLSASAAAVACIAPASLGLVQRPEAAELAEVALIAAPALLALREHTGGSGQLKALWV